MPANVTRLHNGTPGDGDDLPPGERYKLAVEEYRFQAQFNWSRTQYLFALNALVLAAGAGLVVPIGQFAIVIFSVGMCTALATIAVVKVQHGYYRNARDRMRSIERQVVPQDERINTTTSMGGRARKVSVNQVIYGLLVVIALANIAGIAMAVWR